MKCINCKNYKLKKIVKIGNQPISSLFYSKKKTKLKKYPLDLFQCQKCKLVQLSKLAPLSQMYGETYGYHTSLSPLMVKHMREKFNFFKKKFGLKKTNNILDIGCNDGTFLNFFAKKGFSKLYGIDPSVDKFSKFHDKKIKSVSDFFSEKNLRKNFSIDNFDLITSFAMFYDIEDPNSFCKDIYSLLKPNGIWVLELSYLPLLIENLTYDQICHEHIAYYDLQVLNNLIEKNGLTIIDVRTNDINGGSIEVSCSKKKSFFKPNSKKINSYLENEICLYKKDVYKNLSLRIQNCEKNLIEFLNLAKISKKKFYGYGASTKGNIVLNRINANNKLLPYIGDANTEKHGRYTPGTNIKILSKKEIRNMNPDYLVVLIWSFRSEVIRQEINYLNKGGKLIFHLPILHVIDKYNYKDYLKKDINCLN